MASAQEYTTTTAQISDDVFAPTARNSNSIEHGSAMQPEKPEYGVSPVDAFGDEVGAAVQYKTMEWWQGAMGEPLLESSKLLQLTFEFSHDR
jgi:hypothetical protein